MKGSCKEVVGVMQGCQGLLRPGQEASCSTRLFMEITGVTIWVIGIGVIGFSY